MQEKLKELQEFLTARNLALTINIVELPKANEPQNEEATNQENSGSGDPKEN